MEMTKIKKIKFLIKNNFGNTAPPPVKSTRLNRYIANVVLK